MRMFERGVRRQVIWLILLLTLGGVAQLVLAEEEDEEDEIKFPWAGMDQREREALVQEVLQAPPAKKGADTCLKCHDEDNEYPVMPLFRTKHATVADPRTPFANEQCESCHGPGGNHMKKVKGDELKAPILNFGKDAWTPAKAQNARCLTCHQNHQRIEWQGSTHEFNKVACASCHKIHVAHDPVMDRSDQPEVCYDCHANLRAKFYQTSRHPVREHQMSCSECHDVHGEDGTGLMVSARVRQKCTSCHAEKRGPFLWEHQPAAEDCTICHQSHGSNLPSLLKTPYPQLCQQCHAQAGHPSVSYNGSRIPSPFLSVKGCLNCHSQTHGSNDPSGVTLLR